MHNYNYQVQLPHLSIQIGTSYILSIHEVNFKFKSNQNNRQLFTQCNNVGFYDFLSYLKGKWGQKIPKLYIVYYWSGVSTKNRTKWRHPTTFITTSFLKTTLQKKCQLSATLWRSEIQQSVMQKRLSKSRLILNRQ